MGRLEAITMQEKSPRRILTVDEVRDEYGIPISTQRLWRAEGRFVPWYRAGTRIVYRRELIERWVEEQEQKARATRCGHADSTEDHGQEVGYPEPRTGIGPFVASDLATRTGGDEA
jgi:hypothetical protein